MTHWPARRLIAALLAALLALGLWSAAATAAGTAEARATVPAATTDCPACRDRCPGAPGAVEAGPCLMFCQFQVTAAVTVAAALAPVPVSAGPAMTGRIAKTWSGLPEPHPPKRLADA